MIRAECYIRDRAATSAPAGHPRETACVRPIFAESVATSVGRRAAGNLAGAFVPSLFRFLIAVGFVAGLIYGGMWALVTFVDPEPREISVRVPADRLRP
jgi:hypothetical protein